MKTEQLFLDSGVCLFSLWWKTGPKCQVCYLTSWSSDWVIPEYNDYIFLHTENFQLSNVPEACRSIPLCPCNSPSCPAYTRSSSPCPGSHASFSRGSSPFRRQQIASLSAVHALQPPTYPLSSAVDALPGKHDSWWKTDATKYKRH